MKKNTIFEGLDVHKNSTDIALADAGRDGDGECSEFCVRVLILNLPPKRAEAEASSENGPTSMLVGGAGFCWSGFARIMFIISEHTYQSFNSLSSLPSKNIAN